MDDFNPDWTSPPFDTVLDICEDHGITGPELMADLGLTKVELIPYLYGRVRLTSEIIARLSDCVGGSPEFWRLRDEQYWQHKARLTD